MDVSEKIALWDALPASALVPMDILLTVLGTSKSTAYARMKDDPAFPKPVYLGDPRKRRVVRFRKGDILDYLQILKERSGDPQIQELQRPKGGRRKSKSLS